MEITTLSGNIEFGNIFSETKLSDISNFTTSKEPIRDVNINILPIKVYKIRKIVK